MVVLRLDFLTSTYIPVNMFVCLFRTVFYVFVFYGKFGFSDCRAQPSSQESLAYFGISAVNVSGKQSKVGGEAGKAASHNESSLAPRDSANNWSVRRATLTLTLLSV